MEKTIDFTDLPRKNKTYAGANGSKISVLLNNELYMIKFPAPAKRNNSLSYANAALPNHHRKAPVFRHGDIRCLSFFGIGLESAS